MKIIWVSNFTPTGNSITIYEQLELACVAFTVAHVTKIFHILYKFKVKQHNAHFIRCVGIHLISNTYTPC